MQKILASIALMSVLSAMAGCASTGAPAEANAAVRAENEYITGSRLPQRAVPKVAMTTDQKEELRRLIQSQIPPSGDKQ